MIVKKKLDDTYEKTYSDRHVLIRMVATGEYCTEAVDPISYHREYVETDIPIEPQQIEELPEGVNIL